MKFVDDHPRGAVALTTFLTGVVGYLYAVAQDQQEQCQSLDQRVTLAAMRSEIGLLRSEVSMLPKPADRREANNIDSPGVMRLGDLAEAGAASQLTKPEDLEFEKMRIYLDRMKNDAEITDSYLEIQTACFGQGAYSLILAFLQILIASLASFIGFIAGSARTSSPRVDQFIPRG